MRAKAMPPQEGMAIGTVMSDPLPVSRRDIWVYKEYRQRYASTVVEVIVSNCKAGV